MAGIVARNYARALLELVREQGDAALERTGEDLARVRAAFDAERDFRAFLSSRLFARKAKKDLLSAVFAGIDPLVLRFLFLLVDRDRMGIMTEIEDAFHDEHLRAVGRREVSVRTAFPLDPETSRKVAESLGRRLGGRVTLEQSLARPLVAGIALESGGQAMELSAKRELEDLKKRLSRSDNANRP